jgi:hypothetical protein
VRGARLRCGIRRSRFRSASWGRSPSGPRKGSNETSSRIITVLTQLLLPKLLKAASGGVVLVSNADRYADTIDFEDLQQRRAKPGLAVAGRTQFANDLFAVELAERLRGTVLEVTCVFPGLREIRVPERAVRPDRRALLWDASAQLV